MVKIHYHKTTYPSAWMQIYRERRYLYVDPVAKRVMSNDTPFFWSEYVSQIDPSEESLGMMATAMQYGLMDGIGCSYLKNQGQLYTFAVSTDRQFEQYDETLLAQIHLAGAYLVDCHQREVVTPEDIVPLTGREREVVSMAAMGKTDSEIAQLTGISINTVRYHWKNIFDKTNSYSRVFAIIRALNLGFIDPHIFEITTNSGSVTRYKKKV